MKSILTALVVSTMTVPAIAGAAHDTCLQAADYKGCMEVQQNGGVVTASSGPLVNLRNAMKQVSRCLSSGTSLRDSSLTFQPVIDAHAIVKVDDQNSLAYQAATIAIDLFNKTQSTWQYRISSSRYSRGNRMVPYEPVCEEIERKVSDFNRSIGKKAIIYGWKKIWTGECVRQTNVISDMYNYVVGVLKDGSTDPDVIKDYKAKREEAIRLSKLGPWQRHLDSRPGLRKWAKANPSAAVKAQEKFNRDNPSDPINLPPLPNTLPYLQGSVLEDYIVSSSQ